MPGLLSAMEGFCVIGIVIATGYVAARMRIGGPTAQMVLNRFSFFVSSPCLMFAILSKEKIFEIFHSSIVVAFFSALLVGVVFLILNRLFFHMKQMAQANAGIVWARKSGFQPLSLVKAISFYYPILRRNTIMLLTRGLTSDFDSVCALYARVTSAMHEKGIAQWNWGTYPNADQIHKSIDAGTLYVVREGNTVVAAVTLDSTFEPAYDAVNWLFGGKPGTFHRLCIAPEKQRQGLGRGMMGEMLAILRSQGCTALRCDMRTPPRVVLISSQFVPVLPPMASS